MTNDQDASDPVALGDSGDITALLVEIANALTALRAWLGTTERIVQARRDPSEDRLVELLHKARGQEERIDVAFHRLRVLVEKLGRSEQHRRRSNACAN